MAMHKCKLCSCLSLRGEPKSVSKWPCFCMSNLCVPPGCRGLELETQGGYGNIGEELNYCFVGLSYSSSSLSFYLTNCPNDCVQFWVNGAMDVIQTHPQSLVHQLHPSRGNYDYYRGYSVVLCTLTQCHSNECGQEALT